MIICFLTWDLSRSHFHAVSDRVAVNEFLPTMRLETIQTAINNVNNFGGKWSNLDMWLVVANYITNKNFF